MRYSPSAGTSITRLWKEAI